MAHGHYIKAGLKKILKPSPYDCNVSRQFFEQKKNSITVSELNQMS